MLVNTVETARVRSRLDQSIVASGHHSLSPLVQEAVSLNIQAFPEVVDIAMDPERKSISFQHQQP